MRFSTTPRRRELSAWLGALVLHALGFGLVRGVAADGVASDAAPILTGAAERGEFEVELGASEPTGRLEPGSTPGTEQQQSTSDDHEQSAHSPRSARLSSRATAPSAPALVDTPPEAASAEPDLAPANDPAGAESAAADAREPRQPVDLGIGPDAWQRWARTGGDTPEREPQDPGAAKKRPLVRAPVPSKTGGLQEGLEAGDRARGLGPSGRIATALFQATHSEAAPQLGVAHFSVTVLRSGLVEVSLTSANRESEKWRAVAQRAALALRKAPPRIPPSRDGVRLTVDVTAEETYPNGSKPSDLHGPRLEADFPGLQSSEASQAEVEALNPVASKAPSSEAAPPLIFKVPGVYVSGRGKVCGYRIGITALGPLIQGGCDPSNIGSKPQRMVRVAVQDQSFF